MAAQDCREQYHSDQTMPTVLSLQELAYSRWHTHYLQWSDCPKSNIGSGIVTIESSDAVRVVWGRTAWVGRGVVLHFDSVVAPPPLTTPPPPTAFVEALHNLCVHV
ncbi:hypothetical protein J6590_021540 [Homalodisca vitripennis]|nr:hypothetical protein J6590_021540 [Homalodisca vitripennis]